MTSWDEMEQGKRNNAQLAPYSGHFAVVLWLVLSLAAFAIISKQHLVTYLWIEVAAVTIPVPIALYFENRILRRGVVACVVAIFLPLGAAVLFGI